MSDTRPLCPDEEQLIRTIRDHRRLRHSKVTVDLRHGRVFRITSVVTEEVPQPKPGTRKLQE